MGDLLRLRHDRLWPVGSASTGRGYVDDYQLGKPMRPDVALAFDRMAAAARREARLFLSVTSGFA